MTDPNPPLTPDPIQPAAQAPQDSGGMSTGAKVGIGCGAGCLVLLVVGVIAVLLLVPYVNSFSSDADEEFAELGITEVVEGDILHVTAAPTQPTHYKGTQVVLDFQETVTVPIGASGVSVEIGGTYDESVYARAGTVILQSDVAITKELNVETLTLQKNGADVDDVLTGDFKFAK